ncbi:MAG: thioredoxin-disulfide reductase [Spirochaetota bacterium]
MRDLIIIGGGPAGLSAGIYAVRSGLDAVIIESMAPGGQVIKTAEVENYPGFENSISGFELISGMEKQARRLGTEVEIAEITSVHRDDERDCIVCTASSGNIYEAKAVIAATGSKYKHLEVPGETELTGRGVSYCATCDGAFFRDKITAVVGGGNTALDEALFLTRFASKVYIIHRRDRFRASKILVDRALSNEKIEPVYNAVVTSINGREKVESVSLAGTADGRQWELATDGLFIFIGFLSLTEILPDSIKNEWGQIKTDCHMRTEIPGIYAAGDIRTDSRKQIVTAAADGATAAMSAYEYITHDML